MTNTQASGSASTNDILQLINDLTSTCNFATDLGDFVDAIVVAKEVMSKNGWRKDVPLMIALFFERGNNIGKLLGSDGRISPAGQQLVKSLKNKYNLQSRANEVAGQSTRNALTLARVNLASPALSLKYSVHRRNQPIIYNGPKCLAMQAFASIIPQGNHLDVLRSAHACVMHRLSLAINSTYKAMSKIDQHRTTLNYVNAGINNSKLDQTDRFDLLHSLQVIISTGNSSTAADGIKELAEEFDGLAKAQS